MGKTQLEQAFIKILSDIAGYTADSISLHNPLIDYTGSNQSFEAFAVVLKCEEEFNVSVMNDILGEANTGQQFVDIIWDQFTDPA